MGNPVNSIELARLIDEMKRNMPLHIQASTLTAQSYFAYYQDLKKAGFTEEQALEIIKARGLS